MSDLGDVLAAVKAVIDASHTTYVVLEHQEDVCAKDMLNAVSLARDTLTEVYKAVSSQATALGGQVVRLGLVADSGQVHTAAGVLALGMDDCSQATGALLAASGSLSDFIARMTRAVEMIGNGIANVTAANEMLREWYPFDDIGLPDGNDGSTGGF